VLHVELQEGKIRVVWKRHCREFQATAACTLRLTKGACGSEKGKEEADCVKRACTGDSWFVSVATAVALKNELNVDFVGTAKTATKGFLQQATRRVLATMERGDHCVFHCAGLGLRAVGWHDWPLQDAATPKLCPLAARLTPGSRLKNEDSATAVPTATWRCEGRGWSLSCKMRPRELMGTTSSGRVI
jgi:hypothetical protein